MPQDLIRKAGLTSVGTVRLQIFTQDGEHSRELPQEMFRYFADIAKNNKVTFFSTPIFRTNTDLIEVFSPN